jgi:hypothetical protein
MESSVRVLVANRSRVVTGAGAFDFVGASRDQHRGGSGE